MTVSLRPGNEIDTRISLARLNAPPPVGTLRALQVHCDGLFMQGTRFRCPRGEISLEHPLLAGDRAAIRFDVDTASGGGSAALDMERFAGGRLQLQATLAADGWRVEGEFAGIAATELAARLGTLQPLPLSVATGEIAGTLVATGSDEGLAEARGSLHTADFGFDNADGTAAGEGLGAALELEARRTAAGWGFTVELSASAGGLYVDPIYLEAGEEPVLVSARGSLDTAGERVRVEQLSLMYPGVASVAGNLELLLAEELTLAEAALELAEAPFGPLFDLLLRPFLVDSNLESLGLQGWLGGSVRVTDDGAWRVEAQMLEVSAEDADGRFAVDGLNARVAWSSGEPYPVSVLSWRGGRILRLPLGPTIVRFSGGADAIRLLDAVEVPVFDGGLVISNLKASRLGSDTPSVNLDGHIRPVDLELVTEALDLPVFAGRVSAMIPDTVYAENTLQVRGTVLLSAFDGDVLVRDLRLEDPLGVLPGLLADVQISGLDLEPLTRAFAFGKMQGRLDGVVSGLRLENWRPVAFDARLATPEDDRSRHRISQRAVDNLSSLGGQGVSGTLSRSFLGIFEEFSYDKLGLSCRLRNGLCEMGGVQATANGYYIVKGGGIPRIDVIGYNRRVDWDVLLQRLRAATGGGAPVVE